jgi:hypothetical protein
MFASSQRFEDHLLLILDHRNGISVANPDCLAGSKNTLILLKSSQMESCERCVNALTMETLISPCDARQATQQTLCIYPLL